MLKGNVGKSVSRVMSEVNKARKVFVDAYDKAKKASGKFDDVIAEANGAIEVLNQVKDDAVKGKKEVDESLEYLGKFVNKGE